MGSDLFRSATIRFRRLAAGAILVAAAIASCRRIAPAAAVQPTPAPDAARRAEPPRAAVRPAPASYAFTAAETASVDDFLRHNPALRMAADGDRRVSGSDSDVRGLYGIYHPYFVRGDMNDDGMLDFVLGFVRRDNGSSAPWFSVVVFMGRAGGGSASFSPGSFIERDVTLSRGDVSVDRDSVVITPDLDEDSVRRYKWDAAGHAFVFVPDESDEADPPAVVALGVAARPSGSRIANLLRAESRGDYSRCDRGPSKLVPLVELVSGLTRGSA
ncbi:MAG: hypothetical protein ABI592_16235 [Acidobacteriota bacterium]